MRRVAVGSLCFLALMACSVPKPAAPPVSAADPVTADVPDATGPSGGSDEASLPLNRLTGVPGIDRAEDLNVRVLGAQGTGHVGTAAVTAGPLPMNQWILTDAGSEFEITVRSSLMPDGVVRLGGRSALLIEPPPVGLLPQFRVFGGHAAFYMPHLPPGEVTILTPAGSLFTRGAVFTVTVSPDFQVLVTCRDGSIFLDGAQNAVAQPGQVFVADRFGQSRVYAMTPDEAQIFTQRWLTVMTDDAPQIDAAVLPQRLAAWKALDPRVEPEQALFLALWFREARTVLGASVPGPEVWNATLTAPFRSSLWQRPPVAPGLLGESP